jgi:ankyrin repeat protein
VSHAFVVNGIPRFIPRAEITLSPRRPRCLSAAASTVRVRRYMRKGAQGSLHAAVLDKADVNVVTKLVEKGADVEAQGSEGLTPLLLVTTGQEDIARALLSLKLLQMSTHGEGHNI